MENSEPSSQQNQIPQDVAQNNPSQPLVSVTKENPFPPNPTKSHSNWIKLLVAGVVIIAILGAGGYFLGMKHNDNPFTNSMLPQSTVSSDLSVVYQDMTYSTLTQSWSDKTGWLTDLTNVKKQKINLDNFANVISPSGTHFGKITKNTISTAINNDPTTFRKIVDISNRTDILDLDGFFWSPDESKIAFEVRVDKVSGSAATNNLQVVDSHAEYYTINYDGSNQQLVGEIKNYPGGYFEGYDFTNNIIYATKTNIGAVDTQTLVAFDPKTNSTKQIITLPNADVVLSPDYSKLYYSLDNKTVTELKLSNGQKRVIFDISNYQPVGAVSGIQERVSHDGKLLFISAGTNKYIYHVADGTVDQSLNNAKYQNLGLDILTFSPDNNYVMLTSREEQMSQNDPKLALYRQNSFYSNKYCIWDIKNKKIIPFFNCNLGVTGFINNKVNETVGTIAWISNAKTLVLSNNQIPTPTLTPTPEPTSPNEPDFSAKVNNTVRYSDVNSLVEAITAYKKDHGSLPMQITNKPLQIAKNGADLCAILTPTYIATIPRDPEQQFDHKNPYSTGGYITDCSSNYNSGFTVVKDSNNQITVGAPLTKQAPIISATK